MHNMKQYDLLKDFRNKIIKFSIILTIVVIITSIFIHTLSHSKHLSSFLVFDFFALITLGITLFLFEKKLEFLSLFLIGNYIILISLVYFVTKYEFNPYAIVWYPPIAMSAMILARLKIGTLITFITLAAAISLFHTTIPYIQASIYLSIIAAALFGWIIEQKLFEFAQKYQQITENLYKLSTTDPLTQLYNRRFFFEECTKKINLAKRKSLPIALLSIDLDHFKQINDQFGHAKGDEILTSFAKILQKSLRGYDIVARMGGEEFAVCIIDENLNNVRFIANKILENIRKIEVAPSNNLSVSIGIAFSKPHEDTNLQQLLVQADKALYRAKERGRDRIEVYEEKN